MNFRHVYDKMFNWFILVWHLQLTYMYNTGTHISLVSWLDTYSTVQRYKRINITYVHWFAVNNYTYSPECKLFSLILVKNLKKKMNHALSIIKKILFYIKKKHHVDSWIGTFVLLYMCKGHICQTGLNTCTKKLSL